MVFLSSSLLIRLFTQRIQFTASLPFSLSLSVDRSSPEPGPEVCVYLYPRHTLSFCLIAIQTAASSVNGLYPGGRQALTIQMIRYIQAIHTNLCPLIHPH